MIVINRRNAMLSLAALGLSACMRVEDDLDWRQRLREIERAAGGTLGAYLLDTASGQGIGWREEERFAHCSSFKLSLAALALSLQERGELSLTEPIAYGAADLLHHSPVTSERLATGSMTIGELARATLVTSDNAAANLLLRRFGGTEALTGFWRKLGDDVSRLDRYEPELNDVPKGELRDTTTPIAMAQTLARLLTGKVLGEAARDTLERWTMEVQTGGKRLRAGLPSDWRAGDKTGTGVNPTNATYVDIGWFVPPSGRTIIVTGYFRPSRIIEPTDPAAEKVLADLGAVAADWALRA